MPEYTTELMPEPTQSPQPPSTRLYLLPITMLALALRLGIVWLSATHHSLDWFFGQATELDELATSLLNGHGLASPFGGNTGPSAFLAPGYPALVAAVFAIFHPYSRGSMLTLTILQAVFGAGTVAVVMHMCRRVFSNATANVAGFLCAVSPPLIFLTTLFWETSCTILLLVGVIAVALACAASAPDEGATRSRWIVAGTFSAGVLAINPSLLFVVVCSLAWAAWQSRPRSLKPLLLGVLTCVLLCAPWVVRNEMALHAFIPLRSNFGYELWQGNRAGADGFFSPELHLNADAGEFARYKSLGEVAYMREKSAQSRVAIGNNPGRFFVLTVKRAGCFWAGISRARDRNLIIYIVITSVVGFCGLVFLARRSRPPTLLFAMPLIVFPLPYYITHPDPRFRLILEPLLILLIACPITTLAERIQRGRVRR